MTPLPSWLARIPEQSPEIVLRLAQDGQVLYMNQSAKAALRDQLEVGRPAIPELATAARCAVTSGTGQAAELPLGGHWYWVTAAADGDETTVFARDVTEHRMASEMLRESEERYRKLLELLPDAVVICQNRQLSFVSPAAIRIFCADRAEALLGLDLFELIHREDHALADEVVQAAQAGGKAVWREVRMRRRDGRELLCEMSGTGMEHRGQAAVQLLLRDITQQRQAERELTKALAVAEDGRRTLQAIMVNVPEGITVATADRVTIRMVSRFGQELLGGRHDLPVDEVVRRWPVSHPDGLPMAVEDTPLVRAIRHGEVVREAELVQLDAHGKPLTLICNAAPIRDEEGRILGGVVTWRDVTETKRIERALYESEARLRVAVKNAAFVPAQVDRNLRYTWIFNPDPGFDSQTVLGKRDDELEDSDGARRLVSLKRRVIESGVGAREQIAFARSDGIHTYDFTVEPMCDAQGTVVGATTAAFDVTERKRQEEALRQANDRLSESEETYRTLVELAPDAVVVHQNRKIVFGNAAALRLYGAETIGQLVGRDILELAHPDDRDHSSRRIDLALGGARTPIREYRLRTLDGREVPAEAAGARIQYQGSPAVQVIIRDITERKRAEEALRRSQEEYRHIVEGSGSVILRVDKDMRITFMNQHGLRFFGYSRDEILGKRACETIIPASDDQGSNLAAMAEHLMQHPERYATNVHQNRRKDGRLVWMSWANNPIYDDRGNLLELLVVGNDLSELMEAEQMLARQGEMLRRSEERFRSLVRTLPQIVFDVAPDTQLGYFNERWAEYTGHQPGGFQDRLELVHPHDRERVASCWANAIRTGTIYECEYRFRRYDGEYRWFLGRALPIDAAPGAPPHWLGTLTDVHELKLAQEALREADRHKNEFLAALSHELRNPLAPIKNCLYVLERATPGGEQARRAQAVISRQVDQLSRLVDDLLDVTRISRNKIQLQRARFELNELVRGTVEDHDLLFEKAGVRVQLDVDGPPIFVHADPHRIAQMVGNLLQNAAKFTPAGGSVVVSLSVEADRAVMQFADTGIGFEPSLGARLFRPFMQADTTLDRSKGGLGLGLALVKGFVDLHGGDVCAASRGPGSGSVFTVRLPVDLPPSPGTACEQARASKVHRRVLVIEDNVDAAESLREVLQMEGHDVAVAYSGPAGLAEARSFRPDIVLCDIGLPQMDGYEVARAFRADENLKGAYLVALSGYALPEDLKRSAEAGFWRHLSKPPTIEKLDEVLAKAGETSE